MPLGTIQHFLSSASNSITQARFERCSESNDFLIFWLVSPIVPFVTPNTDHFHFPRFSRYLIGASHAPIVIVVDNVFSRLSLSKSLLARYPKKFCTRLSILITTLDITSVKRSQCRSFLENSSMFGGADHLHFLGLLE